MKGTLSELFGDGDLRSNIISPFKRLADKLYSNKSSHVMSSSSLSAPKTAESNWRLKIYIHRDHATGLADSTVITSELSVSYA